MRSFINSASLLSSFAVFSASTDAGSAGIPAENAVIDIANVAPIIASEAAATATKTAKLRGKRLAATKPATDKPTTEAKPVKPANGKRPAKQAAAITPAKPDPRAAKAERIAVDRNAVAKLYTSFEANRDSIPVKPLSAFKPSTTTAHPIARNPSTRQAAAISLAFAAAGKKLSAGTSVPRVFEINGIRSCIENGVLRDAVSSGLCTVSGDSPETETIRLAAKADKAIIGLIGERIARAGKLI